MIRIDSQNFAAKVGDVLRVQFRIHSAGSVTRADIEISVGSKQQVVSIVAVRGESQHDQLARRIRCRVRARLHREARNSIVRRFTRFFVAEDVKQAILRIPRMKTERIGVMAGLQKWFRDRIVPRFKLQNLAVALHDQQAGGGWFFGNEQWLVKGLRGKGAEVGKAGAVQESQRRENPSTTRGCSRLPLRMSRCLPRLPHDQGRRKGRTGVGSSRATTCENILWVLSRSK